MQFQQEGGKTISESLFLKIVSAVAELERKSGKTYGDVSRSVKQDSETSVTRTVTSSGLATPPSPLILCMRSGALVSSSEQAHTSIGAPESWKVPGVMSTLLGLGMNDVVLDNLVTHWNAKSALNAYAHFIMSFGTSVYGVPISRYHNVIFQIANSSVAIKKVSQHKLGGVSSTEENTTCTVDYKWTEDDLIVMIEEFKKIQAVPTDVWEQLKLALTRVSVSWFSNISVTYRDNLDMYRGSGIAVIVNEQILGGSGVFSTRSPITGSQGLFGFYWPEASGEKLSMEGFAKLHTKNYKALCDIKHSLEWKFRDMQDVEFAMDKDEKIWILNSMAGHRRPAASVRIAMNMIKEGILTERSALLKIDPQMIDRYSKSLLGIGTSAASDLVAGNGIAASDGVVTGQIAFSLDECMGIVANGQSCILCKNDCDVNDINAVKISSAVLTLKGTATSPTAIFCRGLNKVCVTGVSNMSIMHMNGIESLVTLKGILHNTDVLTVNGATGMIYSGVVTSSTQPHVGTTRPTDSDIAFHQIMELTDKYRKVQVFAYAKNMEDCRIAMGNHADSVALLQTDWMFASSEDRLALVRTILFSTTEKDVGVKYEELESLLVRDFRCIFATTNKHSVQKPVIIQLFDNELCDFLPSNEQQLVKLAATMNLSVKSLKDAVCTFKYKSKHSGLLGRRAYSSFPDLIAIQVRALLKACDDVNEELSTHKVVADVAEREILTQIEKEHQEYAVYESTGKGDAGMGTVGQSGDNAKVQAPTGSSKIQVEIPPAEEKSQIAVVTPESKESTISHEYNPIVPLISLPMTATWEEVERLTAIVNNVTNEVS